MMVVGCPGINSVRVFLNFLVTFFIKFLFMKVGQPVNITVFL